MRGVPGEDEREPLASRQREGGAMAEVAAGGGALLADPRDWHSLLEAARRMLTDQALLAELGAQARARQFCSWSSYAADVWQHLVGRELGPASG